MQERGMQEQVRRLLPLQLWRLVLLLLLLLLRWLEKGKGWCLGWVWLLCWV